MNLCSIEPRQVRATGAVMVPLFGGLAIAAVWLGKPLLPFVFGGLCLMGCCFLATPGPMRSVYRVWCHFGHMVGRVLTAGALTLAFYLVITPVAVIKRRFGSETLPMRPDREAPTYWVERDEAIQPKERFVKRY